MLIRACTLNRPNMEIHVVGGWFHVIPSYCFETPPLKQNELTRKTHCGLCRLGALSGEATLRSESVDRIVVTPGGETNLSGMIDSDVGRMFLKMLP